MSKLKAAESRGLVEVCEQLAREYNTGTAAHNHRQQVFENLAKLYSVFDKASFCFVSQRIRTGLRRNGAVSASLQLAGEEKFRG